MSHSRSRAYGQATGTRAGLHGGRAFTGTARAVKVASFPVVPVEGDLGECPVCHGGVRLMEWRHARVNFDVKEVPQEERVPRLAKHFAGGTLAQNKTGPMGSGEGRFRRPVACVGSYAIPAPRAV